MKDTKSFEISKQLVWEAWKCVKSNRGSAGIDQQSIEDFETNLSKNLYKVWNRMASGSYFPPPVMGINIPKKSGGTRTLGIPSVADRVAQTVAKFVLEPKLEKVFLEDSYGYRPKKSAHQAIAVTRQRCWQMEWVLEFDIKGLFDNIPCDLLLKALRKHTQCKWVLLYVERWLKAPLQCNDGTLIERTKGMPQGGVISPILSNLFMHYCFDLWMENHFPRFKWCRYADDGLVHCHSEAQAKVLLDKLSRRMKECGLEIHPEKTKIVYCGTKSKVNAGSAKKFTFLSYEFRRRSAKNRKTGKIFATFTPAVSPIALKAIRYEIKHKWKLQSKTHLSLQEIAAMVNPIIQGWINYYTKFNPSYFVEIAKYINERLRILVQKKFTNLRRRKPKAIQLMKRIIKENPALFAHWKWQAVY